TYIYNDLDQLVKVIQPDPDGEGELTSPETTYSYDLLGRLARTTDAMGVSTFYEYDVMGRVTKTYQSIYGLRGEFYEVTNLLGFGLQLWAVQQELMEPQELLESEYIELLHVRNDGTINFPQDDHFAGFEDMTEYVGAYWK